MRKLFTILLILSQLYSEGQILLQAGWESGNVLQGVFSSSSLPYYPGYSATIDSQYARVGSKSVKFQLNDTDRLVAAGSRSELTLTSTNPLNPSLRWFAWSEYLPANYASDILPEIHFQIADNTGLTAPNVAMWLRQNRWFINFKYNIGAGNVEIQQEITNSGATLGGWTDWVIYYLPAIDNTGIVELYRNGTLVYRRTGPNANAQGGVLVPSRYPKFGVYKWPWNNPGTYNPSQRITYVDEVKYGGASSQLSDFIIAPPDETNLIRLPIRVIN
jgi:hypothetical protein